jgi:hypothetical protein
MNELYKDKLAGLAEDELLLKVIRAVFDERIEQERPQTWDDDNSKLGEKYRAYLQAKQIIDRSFVDLGSYKVDKLVIKKFNKEI